MSLKKTLVFPAGMPRSLAYSRQAKFEGREVVGASSLQHDPVRSSFEDWAYLPYITDPDFFQALKVVVQEHAIGGVFTPNAVVWDMLSKSMPKELPEVQLVNSHPLKETELPYTTANHFAQSHNDEGYNLFSESSRDLPKTFEIASIYHHVEAIPGMCDHDKIRALFAIFQSAAPGDIVEVGSWWGKSAVLLLLLARLNNIGPVLCVDPWALEYIAQHDEAGLVDAVDIDPSNAFNIFLVNLFPIAQGRLNYLRKPSVEAAKTFMQASQIKSSEFGAVDYSREIAILHIDGNHSERAVREDVSAWCPLVKPGGWIVLDDYVWPYGEGPKIVGDQFLSENEDRILTSFVMGSALFIKLAQ